MNFLFIGAFLFDTIIGDPRGRCHPVVLIGNLISFFTKKLLKTDDKKNIKRLKGFLLVLLTLFIVLCITSAILYLLKYNTHLYFFGSMILLSFTISPRALAESAFEIKKFLKASDLPNARKKVGWIVGRDTENLDESECTRATVETVAENITDGIISPLFYAFFGGVVLAFIYRAVNTLDSMVGYKNEQYIDFGMPAARLDDVFNYIPARITAMLIIVIAFILPGYSGIGAVKMLLRDAIKHPSPNSGFAEAPVAGALKVRLGGYNYYFGKKSFRAYMGDDLEILKAGHIRKTVVLMYLVTVLFITIITF